MQSFFNITSVTPDYTNKLITIKANFKVDPDTVTKKSVQVIIASSGLPATYKLSVNNDEIIISLKDWPDLNDYCIVKIDKIKDKLNRDLVHPISKNIIFKADTKLKVTIHSPNNNEAVIKQHNLVYFSINQINPDGSISTRPMPEPLPNSELINKEAVLEDESNILYHFEFASDTAFFDIVKEYKSIFTEGLIQLNDGQYYMRARVIEKGMNGDWSDIITFAVIPDTSECDKIISEAKKDYLEDILAPVDFFIDDFEQAFEIVSQSENGKTFPEFFIEFSKNIDSKKLPETIIANRRDL